MAVIRSYNLWYAFAHLLAHSCFWLLLNFSLALSSRPLMIATALTASLIIWFAYRVVLTIDRGVASRLGVAAGDIIRSIDERDVSTVDEVLAFRMPAFKPWSIVLTRAGQEITLKRK